VVEAHVVSAALSAAATGDEERVGWGGLKMFPRLGLVSKLVYSVAKGLK